MLNKESGIVRLNQIGEDGNDAKICELTGGEFYFKGVVGLPEEFFIQYKENRSSRKGTNFLSDQAGKPFLDFELPDSAGIMHRFSTVAKGKVTLIWKLDTIFLD